MSQAGLKKTLRSLHLDVSTAKEYVRNGRRYAERFGKLARLLGRPK